MFRFTFGLYWSSVYEHLTWHGQGARAAALQRTEKTAEVPFAMIPLPFGIQQLTEGVIWLTFRHDLPLLKRTMT